jgi:DinB superfamily
MSEITELLERFRRGAELLAMSMTGAAGAELDFVPGPGKWSVRQIICHLADAEIVAAMRFRQIIAEERPAIQGFDEKAWATNLGYSKRKASHVIEIFRLIRGENYELLKDLPEEAFERVGIHSERGPFTLFDMVKTFTNHPEKHTVQLRAVRAAYKESKAKPVS